MARDEFIKTIFKFASDYYEIEQENESIGEPSTNWVLENTIDAMKPILSEFDLMQAEIAALTAEVERLKNPCGNNDEMKLKNIRAIYKNNKPYGVRDEGGYLFFFAKINKFPGQEERYRTEIDEQFKLADYLVKCLQGAKK